MEFTRNDMQSALKRTVVPHLRSAGFRGSLPHFHRIVDSRIDLLSVQYYSSGSCLLIEIGTAKLSDSNDPTKGRVWPYGERLRLYSGSNRNNHWFCYTPWGHFSPMQTPEEIADQFVALIMKQAEPWWAAKPAVGS